MNEKEINIAKESFKSWAKQELNRQQDCLGDQAKRYNSLKQYVISQYDSILKCLQEIERAKTDMEYYSKWLAELKAEIKIIKDMNPDVEFAPGQTTSIQMETYE